MTRYDTVVLDVDGTLLDSNYHHTVAYDAYIQPAAQAGRSATVAVWVDQHEVAPVDLRTHLLP